MTEVLLFNVDNQKLAFDIANIERAIWAVEVTPLPKSTKCLLGIINMHGKIIPVVNLRLLLGLPTRKLKISDQFLIGRVNGKTVALWIDGVQGLATITDEQISPGSEALPEMKTLDYVIRNGDEMTLVYKWNDLIPMEEVSHSIQALT